MINFLFASTPLKYLVASFWRDEAFTALLARYDIVSILKTTAADFNPPLYYILLHMWMKLFGSGEVALRIPSLIFFWGTIYVVYLIFTDILKLSTRKSYLYLLLFIANPFLNYYAFEARMYTMLAAIATLSFYFLYKKKKWAYFIAALLGLYTHYFMLFVVAAQALYSLAIAPSRKRLKQLFLYIGIGICFAPWAIFVFTQNNLTGQSFWIINSFISNLVQFPAILYTGYEDKAFVYKPEILIALSIGLYLLLMRGLQYIISKRFNKDRNLFVLLYIWALGIPGFVLLFSFIKPIFLPRYLIFSAVGLIVLLVAIFERMSKEMRFVAIAILIAITLHYNHEQLHERLKANMRDKIATVKQMAKPGDVIYIEDELNFHEAQYYFDENHVYIYNRPYSDIAPYVGKVLIPEKYVTNTLPQFPRRAFVLDKYLNYQIESSL